ncbi:MAG: helix-turn-helix transcriptional regulator [Sphingopyxis sp.]|uniref:helix-turn-helix transcriptional regulator n=1 Tax=Sphingopyxis sp. TaxID=1908224 RepID=UPI002ABB4530|nr:helix-turn-helix transcriptional regulator [Sphingopyxis sp.]MDZ3832246.1 helix-turn-helix transcriptional regulator [Sphingopyxis sp.]
MTGRGNEALEGERAAAARNDVELIGHSYRTLVDGTAFDDLVAAWNRRIGSVDSRGDGQLHLDAAMLDQFAEVGRLATSALQVVDNDPADELLARCVTAAMVQNSDGRVVAINPGGRLSFGLQTGDIDAGAWLAPVHVAALRQLRAQAGERGNSDRRVVECVDPTETDADHKMQLAEVRLVTLLGYPQPLLLIRSLEFQWLETTSDLVEQSWGLTEAEGEIARLFYRHRSLQRIAELRAVSIQTIQTQFKAVLAKTGCRGQVELIRVLTALCIQSGIDAEPFEGEWVNPYRNEQRLVRSGGCALRYSFAGPKDGRPMLWVHGPVFNYSLPRAVIDALDRLRVRLIIPCRPGYGSSEIDRSLSAEEDNIDALLSLVRHLGLQDCPAIGTTSAATMLILARDRAPHLLGRLGFVSAFGKMDESEVRRLTPVHRAFFRLATTAPQMLNYMTALALRLVRRHGPDWYIERAHGYNPRNAEALRAPETQALLRTDTRAMMLQNGAGFARDRMLVLSDPAPALARSDQIDIWLYGKEDSHLHDRDLTNRRGLSERVTIDTVADASELLLYQRPDRICDLIAALLD